MDNSHEEQSEVDSDFDDFQSSRSQNRSSENRFAKSCFSQSRGSSDEESDAQSDGNQFVLSGMQNLRSPNVEMGNLLEASHN